MRADRESAERRKRKTCAGISDNFSLMMKPTLRKREIAVDRNAA